MKTACSLQDVGGSSKIVAQWMMVGGGGGKDTQTHILFTDHQRVVYRFATQTTS